MRVGLCRCYIQQHRDQEALEQATLATGLKFHFPPAHFFLGIARHRTHDIDGAIAALARAIEQNPNFAEAHTRLAMIYDRSRIDVRRSRTHRTRAAQIRDERRRVARARVLPDLPPLSNATIDAQLPELPQIPASNLLPPLMLSPEAPPAPSTGPFATVVSGLPRSGTSMLMQMLAAGGLAPLTDESRAADESNPRGYYELDKVRRLVTDNRWLDEARGKALKVVAPLVPFLPQATPYRVILVERDLDEILASQTRMLERLERQGANLDATRLRQVFSQQLRTAKRVLEAHAVPVLVLRYADILANPARAAANLAEFLEMDLDRAAIERAVDAQLYRERAKRD